ncbi:BpFREP12.13 [Biomphalaria pfeifferi]|uniref:BpFREP12.13 n=1 Tax=Biomphalaria pfeifferi TaxID=112525 RepID=A0AAD8FJ21_BIOPF|nr:BpFREP12.13 [Biomphalaria pfeifferi]
MTLLQHFVLFVSSILFATSELIIDVQPNVISAEITAQLVINCSITNNQVQELDVIRSLTLSRYNETLKEFFDLITLEAKTLNLSQLVQLHHAQISFGNMYISLTLHNPTLFDAKVYRCKVEGDKTNAANSSIVAKKEVEYRTNMTALIEEIRRLRIFEKNDQCTLEKKDLTATQQRTKLHFVGSSKVIKELIESLTLTCSLQDLDRNSTVQLMYILHESNGVIATINKDQPVVTTKQDSNFNTAKGELSDTKSKASFIEISWSYIKSSESGKYFCGAYVMGPDGRSERLNEMLAIIVSNPTFDDLIKVIQKLLRQVDKEKENILENKQNIYHIQEDINSKQQTIISIKDGLDTNRQNINTIKDDLESSRQNIKSITDDLNATRQSIASYDDESNSLRQMLNNVQSDLSICKESIQSFSNDLDTNKQSIASHNDELNTFGQIVNSLKDDLRTNKQSLQSITDKVNTNKQNINQLKENLESNKQKIQSITDEVNTNKDNINQLKENLELNKQKIQSITDEVNTNKDNINQLRENLKSNKQKIQNMTDEVTTNKDNINQLKENLKSNKQNIQNITKGVNTNRQNIINLNKDVKTSQQSFSKLEATLETQLTNLSTALTQTWEKIMKGPPTSCREINSFQERVTVTLTSGLKVMCDTKTDGGGWIIFQRRINGKVDFYRGWKEYRDGFGDYNIGEFYLGNENIFNLTSTGQYDLRIDLEFNNKKYFAQYENFKILSESEKYKLQIGKYSGYAGDELSYHNSNFFTTFDRDNDVGSDVNCAEESSGAWWYNHCHHSNLNGQWGRTSHKGMNWAYFTGLSNSVTFTEMKIKEREKNYFH